MADYSTLRDDFKSKKYTKEEAFRKVMLTNSEQARIHFFDMLFLIGPIGYYYYLYKVAETAGVSEFALISVMVITIYLAIPMFFNKNTLFGLIFGARVASRLKMCYLEDDPMLKHDLNKYAWQKAKQDEVVNVIEDISGKTSMDLVGIGICKVNKKRYEIFKEYYM